MEEFGLEAGDFAGLPKGDPRKGLIAHAVKSATTARLDWIAGRLEMGSRSTVSRCVSAAAAEAARS
ncbi:MAG TPA: hypothetical protein VMN36_08245 [Verrucomicrobiales bacterium]|nr:hypothetical protein [Verrucomicrobiales bacterium]